jgi:hypothetical protein
MTKAGRHCWSKGNVPNKMKRYLSAMKAQQAPWPIASRQSLGFSGDQTAWMNAHSISGGTIFQAR